MFSRIVWDSSNLILEWPRNGSFELLISKYSRGIKTPGEISVLCFYRTLEFDYRGQFSTLLQGNGCIFWSSYCSYAMNWQCSDSQKNFVQLRNEKCDPTVKANHHCWRNMHSSQNNLEHPTTEYKYTCILIFSGRIFILSIHILLGYIF